LKHAADTHLAIQPGRFTLETSLANIVMVTGSYPPDACGVGDYTQQLYEALGQEGLRTELFCRRDWSLRKLVPYVLALRKTAQKAIVIQYPTEGYGYSIVPQLLSICLTGKRVVVALHEFTRKSWAGKAAIFLFFLTARWIIFTTEEEREAACAVAPWLRRRSSVVHVASAIPLRNRQQPDIDLAYFGLIRPGKGLEEFAAVATKLRSQHAGRVGVIGQEVAGYEEYAKTILATLRNSGAELLLNRSPEEVSQLLSRSRIVLLPFPDGISRRRTSALAAMGNGALLVTTPPQREIDLWREICVSTSMDELCPKIEDVLRDPAAYEATRAAGEAFARRNQWPTIARAYAEIASGRNGH
jgi:glycosyltransferase involved in cell wall biosynthesis